MIDYNENRPGYKKSKAGWLPEEGWQILPFIDCCRIGEGQVDPTDEKYGTLMHVGPENIESYSGRIWGTKTAKELGLLSGKYLFDEKSIIYSKIRPNLNKVCIPSFKGLCSADCYPIWPKNGYLRDYIHYYMLSSFFLRQSVPVSLRTGMPKINREDLNRIIMTIPPLHEQKKIADILSTWDEAIEQTRRLIDAKKCRKKALIQQLTTGKKRLPGFNKEWKRYKLSQLIESRNKRSQKTSTLPLYSLTIENGITPKTDRYDREALVKDKDGKQYKKVYPNDIVFNPSNIRWGAIARSKLSFPVLVSPIYEVLSVLDPSICHPIFLSELLCSGNQIRLFASRVEGTLVERMAVKLNVFLTTNANIPPDLAEQSKIADVLSTADEEIKLLERKLSALEKQKRGLMQKLLTGEVRVNG